MSEFTVPRDGPITQRRFNPTSPPETVRAQQLFTSYTNEPNILREDFALRKVDRPEAYQFWHKKEKFGNYASRVLHTNYKTNSGQILQINNTSNLTQNSQSAYNCCSGQQVTVSVVVVSRDEIEAPWREECLYLQSVIEQLEKRQEVKVVKEVDNSRVNELEAEVRRLNSELRNARDLLSQQQRNYQDELMKTQELTEELNALRLRLSEMENQTVVTEQITYLNTEVEVWKKKFININHEFNECQEKLMMAEAELEALRKEKQSKATVVTTTSVTRSSNRQQTGVKSSGLQSSSITKG